MRKRWHYAALLGLLAVVAVFMFSGQFLLGLAAGLLVLGLVFGAIALNSVRRHRSDLPYLRV